MTLHQELSALYEAMQGDHGTRANAGIRRTLAKILDRWDEDVLAETVASAYIRGSMAWADLGRGLVELDTAEGIESGELFTVIILRREKGDG